MRAPSKADLMGALATAPGPAPERPADRVEVLTGPDVSHLAIGLCVALGAVFLITPERHPSEGDLANGRGIALSLLPFL